MPIEDHKILSRDIKPRFCFIITSDSVYRGLRKDEITPLARELIANYGFSFMNSVVVPNDAREIMVVLNRFVNSDCDVIVISGGTGLSRKDLSVDVLRSFCDREIPGYGELFRYLTFIKHGSVAMASRAIACVVKDKLVFTTPGSPDAFRLAMEKLILPEAKHLIFEIRR